MTAMPSKQHLTLLIVASVLLEGVVRSEGLLRSSDGVRHLMGKGSSSNGGMMMTMMKMGMMGGGMMGKKKTYEPRRPLQADEHTPWYKLADALGTTDGSDLLVSPSVQKWYDECLGPFRVVDQREEGFQFTSNHLLYEAADGVCSSYAMCVYENCIPQGLDPYYIWPLTSAENEFLEPDSIANNLPEDPDLPARVMYPRSAADVVAAVNFAKEYKVGISIKTAGHTLFGASSIGGTLLLKMTTKFPDYALELESLRECVDVPHDDSAYGMACAMAASRGRKAVIRVGGGELFDGLYRAVYFNWNDNPDNVNKYHVVGGFTGTVAAAGGWTASGGLSGTTGMRLFGYGSDQVMHVEMVLPDGQHVRFGPTEFEHKDKGYPLTKKVTGYCNANPVADESHWDWYCCDDKYDFEDLWYAVRGGGGGTWGVVLSYYYQLHDQPPFFDLILHNAAVYAPITGRFSGDELEAVRYELNKFYLKFFLSYFYTPEDLGVSEENSNLCNTLLGSMEFDFGSPLLPGLVWCYSGSGPVFIEAWTNYVLSGPKRQDLLDVGVTAEEVDGLVGQYLIIAQLPSYAHQTVETDPRSSVPVGQIQDGGNAALVSQLAYPTPNDPDSFAQLLDMQNIVFPLDILVNKQDEVIDIMAQEALDWPGNVAYMMGGFAPYADDGMTAFPQHRRNGAFFRSVRGDDYRNQYLELFYGKGPVYGKSFGGLTCHNHALSFEMGPLKEDWTKTCPVEWPQSERSEKCVSQFEAWWGTDNYEKLQEIKAWVDPDGLFICNSGIGWDYSIPH